MLSYESLSLAQSEAFEVFLKLSEEFDMNAADDRF